MLMKPRLATVLAFALLNASALAATPQPDSTFSLDGTWKFSLAPTPADAEKLEHFYQPGFDTAGFKTIAVPSNWALKGFERPTYGQFKGDAGEGFYLDEFRPPAAWKGRRLLLHFGGVWSSAEIWLNGQPVGRHDTGFNSFSFDVSSLVRYDAPNELAVRVRQKTHDYVFDTNDDWALGGIYRDVSLECTPGGRWIDRVDTTTTFDDQFRDADLHIRVMDNDTRTRQSQVPPGLRAASQSPPPYDLVLTLTDNKGKEIQRQSLSIPAHPRTGHDSSVTMHVLAPDQWTAETPNLYTLRVDLVEEGKLVQTRAQAVGFRQISTTGGVFRINGQAVKLRGVDRHDEAPAVGRATGPKDWLQDLQLMKAANINFIRTSHYPPAEGFLDLCDSMGMYVEDEVPMGYGGDHADDPSFAATVAERSYETVSRDINHPAIVIWSIGNEDPLTSLHVAALRMVKGLDPTRPLLMPWHAEESLPPEIDILAPHYFTATQYDQLAAHATRPIVTTEFTHAFQEQGFGGLEERWTALTKHPAGAGGAIWMWADQGLIVDGKLLLVPDGSDGIVNSDRTPQRDYWETRAVYSPVALGATRLEFVPGDASVRVPVSNDFDFTDLNTVLIRWKLMEDGRELSHGEQHVGGKAHSTEWLELPLRELSSVHSGSTYYAQFTFIRPDGSEMGTRSLELRPRTPVARDAASLKTWPITVADGQGVKVTVADASYTFDPKTAALTSAVFRGTPLVTGSKLTIWRDLNPTEKLLFGRDGRPGDLPDMNQYRTTVRVWSVDKTDAAVRITAEIQNVIDAQDSFTARMVYTILNTGSLSVHYVVEPHVRAPWLPHVGISLQTANLGSVRWLGLGPMESYPNEKEASILGVWSGKMDAAEMNGIRTTRWEELASASHGTVRIEGAPYMQVTADRVDVLSDVVGRPEKNRRPSDPDQRLDTTPGRSFAGEFTVRLVQ